MKKLASLLFIFLVSFFIAGCSSGGGGDSEKTAVVNLTLNVQNGDRASVQVISYDSSDKKLEEKNGQVTGETFSTPVKIQKDGHLVINITKEGYTDWNRRIKIHALTDITLNAVLNPVQAQSVIPVNNNTITISSTGKQVINIALVNNSGKKTIIAGKKIKALSNGNVEFSMEIPRDAIPSNTTALKVSLSSFDPEKDADKFPGDYVDQDGNRLVSLGFDFVDIRDANTDEPVLKKSQLSKTQQTQFRIKRFIRQNVCDNLMRDFCTGAENDNQLCSSLTEDELNGYNVPFYRFDNTAGNWELLGIGTVDLDGNRSIDSNDAVNGINIVDFCNANGGIYVIIVITNPEFRYCNLDYPVVNPPVELCVIKKFVDEEGNPFTNVIAYLTDDDYRQSFLYTTSDIPDQNGVIRLTTWNISNDGDKTANLVYSYSATVEGKLTVITKKEQVELGTPDNCPQVTNQINPVSDICKVQGKVTYQDGSPAVNLTLLITDNYNFFRFTNTDNQGNFSELVPCETELEIYYQYSSYLASFNPNGTVDLDEQSDVAGTTVRYVVTLAPINISDVKTTLHIYKIGQGDIFSEYEELICGDECMYASREYHFNEVVRLMLLPDLGYSLEYAQGCDRLYKDEDDTDYCEIIMRSDRVLLVKFRPETTYTLTVNLEGTGYVMSYPYGIHCSSDSELSVCSYEFGENETVQLTAFPMEESSFVGWQGDCSGCGSNLTCTVTMDSNKQCTAVFSSSP